MPHPSFIRLEDIRVASPCHASWDEMTGTDRVRFCGECKLNVFNLSEMQREEAERLVSQATGRLCVRFYMRRDGTVLTRDCPKGLAAVRARAISAFLRTTAVLGVLFPFALGCREIGGWVREFLAPLAAALQGDMDATLPREPVMGRIHAVIPSRDDSAAMGAMATPPEPSF